MSNAFPTKIAMICLVLLLLKPPAKADNNQRFELRGNLRTQYIFEENRDLAQSSDDPASSIALDGQIDLGFRPFRSVQIFTRVRANKSTMDNLSINPETGETSRDDEFIELRQLWAKYEAPFALKGASLTLGRQRIREPYGLWWNRNLDAANFKYDTTLFKGMIGVGQDLSSYNTSDNDFRNDDENRFRTFTEASWLIPHSHRLELRALYEHDHSDDEETGRLITTNDRDDTDYDLIWAGMRLKNEGIPITTDKNIFFSYRVDLIGQTGELKRTSFSTAPGNLNQVTDTETHNSRAWAFDGALSFALAKATLKPTFSIGYATGSGDSDPGDNTDTTFYRNDLNSSRSNHFGASRAFHNYGEALRPDLSNLQVLSLGTSLDILQSMDLSFVYYRYLLNEIQSGLESSSIRITENNQSRDIGQALDIIMNANLTDLLNINHSVADKLLLRTSLGVFKAGDAYGPAADGEITTRGLAEILLKL